MRGRGREGAAEDDDDSGVSLDSSCSLCALCSQHNTAAAQQRVRRQQDEQCTVWLSPCVVCCRLSVALSDSGVDLLDDVSLAGVSYIARDITERKQFEQRLTQTQKLESLGVLAGGLAHDFNNLLTGILGNVSLAIEMVSDLNPVKRYLQDAIEASERAANLTNQMLAYA